MAPFDLFLGIDIGTSGCKVLAIDLPGEVIATSTSDYPSEMPQPLWSEQDPDLWWAATTVCIQDIVQRVGAERIAAVGLTGQMHGLVLLDGRGQVLRPCILWNDQRTAQRCAAITNAVGDRRVIELTGNPILTGFTAPKISWVREHEPEVFAKVAHILLPKDFIRYRLTGEFLSDVSDASGTSLFDVRQRCWSDEMLTALDVPRAWLPDVTESPVVSAKISAAAASQTGLSAGTPVVAGAGDQAAQAVGTGIVRPGLISTTIGTSGVVFAATETYRVEPEGRLHAFCHALPGMWHLMGVTLAAGGSFEWCYEALGEAEFIKSLPADETDLENPTAADPLDLLIELAQTAPPGCEGLLFLPYLSGERTPHADPNARGVFFGLTMRHRREHLVRAVLEGVCYNLRDSLELIRGLGVDVDEIRVSGGGAQSAFWRQILADVFDHALVTVNESEGAAYGAALLAAVGAGAFRDVAEACDRTIRIAERTATTEAAKTYAALYPHYRALYPALAPAFAAISRLAQQAGDSNA